MTRNDNGRLMMLKQLGMALACLLLLGAVAGRTAAEDMGMVLGKTHGTGDKMLFTLNGEPFFPVIASVSVSASFGQGDVEALQSQGFNVIYTAVDAAWLEPRGAEIQHFLNTCADANMPVIVELGEWDYWRNWLHQHQDANMIMSNGAPVLTFPDYANPAAKDEHLRRFRELSTYLAAYRNHPVIALSIGAYDYYHLPDGETHADFTVPQHATFPQTWLPYGAWAQTGYVDFLKARGFTPSDVGFDSWDAVVPPSEWDNTKTPLHWSTWMWYRKDVYALSWLADTATTAREASGLPVSATLDVRPVGWDDWATDANGWADHLDFAFVYYYGMNSPQETRERLQYFYRAYAAREVPMVTLLEFSSVLGASTSAQDYLRASIPYVSGAQFGFSGAARHEARRSDFLDTARDLAAHNSWQEAPPPADLGILIWTADSYLYAGYEAAARAAEQAGVSFEAVSDLDALARYRLIYVPPNQPLLARQPEYQTRIDALRAQGIPVIEGKYRDLQSALLDYTS
jgi:hypothetical protein